MGDDYQPAAFLWVEEGNGQASTPRPRRYTKKKKEFVGWGSRQLIEFLVGIGRQPGEALSQHDLTTVINEYVNANRLTHPEKKKRVMCDERLQTLFGRKFVNRVKIFDLLEGHLAENQVGSDDDLFDSPDEKEEDAKSVSKRQKTTTSERKTQPKKKTPDVSRNLPAAIITENIKLVYLKRTLVQELQKQPDTFETKVVGSYVRIKADPLDIFQKNSHVLELVTGVKSVAAAGDNCSHTLLQITGATSEISVSDLSNDNFSEEECEDLHRRVKDGLIKQPTVGELEQKVALLHEDITKHWLPLELARLKNLIDQANVKGWRYKMIDCVEKRRVLQTPSEQERLLSDIPKVKPEEVKLDTISESAPDNINQETGDSPINDWDWEPCHDSTAGVVTEKVLSKEDNKGENGMGSNGHSQSTAEERERETALPPDESRMRSNGFSLQSSTFEIGASSGAGVIGMSNGHAHDSTSGRRIEESNGHVEATGTTGRNLFVERNIPKLETNVAEHNGRMSYFIQTQRDVLILHKGASSNGHVQPLSSAPKPIAVEDKQKKQVEVIDLSDDDEEAQEVPRVVKQPIPPPVCDLLMWYYVDPQGSNQGPFSLSALRKWMDSDYFPADFRVWMTGKGPKEAVLLTDVIRQYFPS